MQRGFLPTSLFAACLALPGIATAAEPCSDYAAELEVMTTADQALRKRVDFLDPESKVQRKLAGHIVLVDRTNTERLKALIARCGWPSKAAHGEQTPGHAWLLTQHADHDVAFQKQALALIEEAAAASGEGINRPFAYLYDRVAVAENRPQRYGTQLSTGGNNHCALEFAPMEDRAQVEARRAQLSLPPLDAYKRMVMEMQHCPVPPAHSSDRHYAATATGNDSNNQTKVNVSSSGSRDFGRPALKSALER
ncbi:MAG: hypothetical protein EOP92_18175 [Lysobacteraceae bacterium]|nr:MAG: hypothetical protein EOP92_18175 [Xanthomonadaceae bacterium]